MENLKTRHEYDVYRDVASELGMLKGKVVGEAMAIAIAEIGAQGAERTFCVLSKDIEVAKSLL